MLNVGVVGLGMGRGHARAYADDDRVHLAALCDLDEERLRKGAEEFGVSRTFADAAEMFASGEIDAVSIATPNKFHAPLTMQAVEAGLHVLVEKPMAMNATEGREMMAAARKAERVLMINFSSRFFPTSQALKKQVDAGVLGDVYFARSVWHRRRGMPGFGGWFGQKELAGGGPLIDLGVHRLDLAMWLMGYPRVVSVSGAAYDHIATNVARNQSKAFDVEDLACAFVRFGNGATLLLEASWAVHIAERELMETRVCGTKGGLVQRNVGGGYQFEAEMYVEEDANFFTKTLDWPIDEPERPMNEFVSAILENREPMASAEQGVQVMEVLDAIYESAETGQEVRLDTPS